MGKGGLRRQLRGVERLLARPSMKDDPAGRKKLERRAAELRSQIDESKQSAKERALAVRYRKVKFFEKKKVSRKMLRVQKNIQNCKDEVQRRELQAEKRKLEDMMTYVTFFPKDRKYVSLFAQGSKMDKDEAKALREELLVAAQKRKTEASEAASTGLIDGELDGTFDHGDSSENTRRRGRGAVATATAAAAAVGKEMPDEEEEAVGSVEGDDFFA
eukprot:g2224.t1